MAQVKKQEMREAILASANRLFKENGYHQTSMAAIADAANTAVANIYVYFPTKMDLLYEEYTPRIAARLIQLGSDARRIADPRKRLKFILRNMWQELPEEDNGYSRNLMQAIAVAPLDQEKPHAPLKWNVEFITGLVRECLPPGRLHLVRDNSISFLIWMAFDGFALNFGRHETCDLEQITDHFVDMLLGETPTNPPRVQLETVS